jgi:hypothetical protein
VYKLLGISVLASVAQIASFAQSKEAPKPVKVVKQTVNKPVAPAAEWAGYVTDRKLKSAAPEDGIINSAMKWEHLWKTWHGENAEVPHVDFKKDVLFVFTSGGPNTPSLRLYVTGRSVTGTVGHTLRGGPGFGYRIVKFARKDVTSFFGRAVE